MSALLEPEQVANLPSVRSWLRHAEATSRIIKENYSHIIDPQARITATVEENVLVQLENLRTHPTVLSAMGRGQLRLHGWVYKFETGQVFAFNPKQGQFESVGEKGFEPQPVRSHLRAI
jgi:carbonic anhydrase